MRLLFAGTPAFAAPALQAILAAGHHVALVLTQPDRPSGRGLALRASPVKAVAEANGIPVFQPHTLRSESVCARLQAVSADVFVVAAYGLILPQAVLDLPRFGCLNIHASLLPRWRGAAPIQRAILAGDSETGVSIMQMDAGLDTGPVLRSARLAIADDDTASTLHDRLAALGARLIVETLADWPQTPVAQSAEGVSYATKIDKSEAALDWRLSAARLARQIRAFNPFPGASCDLAGMPVKVWRAEIVADNGPAGRVLRVDRDGIVVACGDGALRLVELQKAGGKRLPSAQFVAGTRLRAGAFCALPTDVG